MKKVYLKISSKDELYYRQKWLRDNKTMIYNAGLDLSIKGYDK